MKQESKSYNGDLDEWQVDHYEKRFVVSVERMTRGTPWPSITICLWRWYICIGWFWEPREAEAETD